MTTALLNKESHDLWEQVAERTWGKYLTQVEERAFEVALAKEPEAGRCLDVGAEQGRWSRRLLPLGWDVTATEICPDKVAKYNARNAPAECQLVSVDDTSLPIADQSVDLVVSMEVAVNSASWFVSELARVLRPRGRAVFTTFNSLSYRGPLDYVKTPENRFYKTSFPAVQRACSRFGLSQVHSEGFCWLPFSRFSNSSLVPLVTKIESHLGLRRLTAISPWVVSVWQKTEH